MVGFELTKTQQLCKELFHNFAENQINKRTDTCKRIIPQICGK